MGGVEVVVKRFQGEGVAGGVALGQVWLQGYDQAQGYLPRVPTDQVEHELNRLRDALGRSRRQIEDIRGKQEGKLSPGELRIFDTHLGYLQDPLFVDEIEKLVMHDRLPVRGAIQKVVGDYDRIFALVENEHLRQRAGDFRDVGIRVLRNLEEAPGAPAQGQRPPGRYVLAAARLTTTDMFDLDNEEVLGIVAEEGGISSHAAILARSMGIPTITGIRDLPDKLENGDFVVVDASAGELVVKPDEAQIHGYQVAAEQWQQARLSAPKEERERATRDGTEVGLLASCGSTGEIAMARAWALDGIGLYRTELSFLTDPALPGEDALVAQYEEVVHQPAGQPVAFRLLDVSATTRAGGVPAQAERNPALGVRGVRWLIEHRDVLRLQLRAILRAAAGSTATAVLVPFVTALSDLTPVKVAILEERQALRKRGVACAETLLVAPIIEVPAAAVMLGTLLAQSDFAVVALDGLQAHVLAADRDNPGVKRWYEMGHPAVFELLADMAKVARKHDKRLLLYGESAADPRRFPFYLGLGYREFSVAPVRVHGLVKVLRRYTIDECKGFAERILQAPRALDIERILVQMGGG